jgi:hypothetical protein
MDSDRMKIINPRTHLPEYVVGEDNLVEDLNKDRIETDRKKKGTPDDTDHRSN